MNWDRPDCSVSEDPYYPCLDFNACALDLACYSYPESLPWNVIPSAPPSPGDLTYPSPVTTTIDPSVFGNTVLEGHFDEEADCILRDYSQSPSPSISTSLSSSTSPSPSLQYPPPPPRRRHRVHHSTQKARNCDECPRSFARAFDLRRHRASCHEAPAYHCEAPGCYRSFKRSDGRLRHWRAEPHCVTQHLAAIRDTAEYGRLRRRLIKSEFSLRLLAAGFQENEEADKGIDEETGSQFSWVFLPFVPAEASFSSCSRFTDAHY